MRFQIRSFSIIACAALAVGRIVTAGFDNTPALSGLPLLLRRGLDFDPAKYADDATWSTYVAKGDHFMCLMQATDKGAGFLTKDTRTPPSAASRLHGELRNELATWFWYVGRLDAGWECDFERMGLKNAFESQGLNAQPAFDDDGDPLDGHNICVSLQHYNEKDEEDEDAEFPQMRPVKDQKYTVGGKEYMATGAFYTFAVNRVDGAIIARNINSPAASVQEFYNWNRKAQPGELPDIQYLSDVYWAYWIRDNANIKSIRVYGAEHVVNDATVLLVSRAFKNMQVEAMTQWPGTSFALGTDEYKALIGSPIGATMAHMLISHKAELGIKQITKVSVVTNEPKSKPRFGERPVRDLHLFFTIEDVPTSDVTEPGVQGGGSSTGHVRTRILRTRGDGRHVIREHKLMA